MHEASLVLAMCEEILRLAEREGAKGVSSITVRIGELSGVEKEAFRFAFEVYQKDDPFFKNAELKIETIPAKSRCRHCGRETTSSPFGPCPYCGQWGLELVCGEELDLVRVEFVLEGGEDV